MTMMANKVGAPFKDPELVKSNCGYKLPKWLKDLIREQNEPAGVLIERVLTKYIVAQCSSCKKSIPMNLYYESDKKSKCPFGCDEKISSFKKVII